MIVAKQGAITSPAELYCSILYKQFNIATPQMHVKKQQEKQNDAQQYTLNVLGEH